jgi:hypothetical protein
MKAIIIQNTRGGWSIIPPGSHRVGNYATPHAAAQTAVKNGWGITYGSVLTESQRRRLVPVLNHAEVEGPLYQPHFERGVKVLRKIVNPETE